jgi:hypothetical protein
MPERGRFDDEDTTPNDGKKRFSKVIDHTAGIAAQRQAAGMLDGLSPPTRDWRRLELENEALMELTPVKIWLSQIDSIIEEHLQKSNFYNNAHDLYEEEVTFGIGAMSIESDPIDVVRFYSYTAGTYYIASDTRKVVNRIYRRYSETAQNLVDKFGEENISHRVKTLIDQNNGDQYVNVRHQIEPNDDRDITKDDNENMPFISVYYEEAAGDTEKPLRVSGFEEFPTVVPRYRVVGTEEYGQSPCMRALGPTKSLQDIEKDFLRASKKTIDPAVNKPQKFKNKNLGAGGVNLYESTAGGDVITPVYQINYDFNTNLVASDKKREAISKILNSDLFAAISNIDTRNMTATEITQRVAEAVKMLVSVITRMNSEFLRPAIERVYNLLLRAGKFPPPPEEIEDEDIKIVFISSLAQAQQAVGLSSIEQLTDYVTRVASIDPTVLDKFNSRQAVDEYGKLSGATPTIVRSDEEVAQIDADRAQKEQQDRTASFMSQAADSANKLGNAPISEDNALGRVVEGVTGG